MSSLVLERRGLRGWFRRIVHLMTSGAPTAAPPVASSGSPPNTAPRSHLDWPEDRSNFETGEKGSSGLSLRPLNDRGGGISVYRGPSGPLGELASIELERRESEGPPSELQQRD